MILCPDCGDETEAACTTCDAQICLMCGWYSKVCNDG